MRLKRTVRKRPEENLVPLINIVFLILIFFLVASTISPIKTRGIELAETQKASKGPIVPRTVVVGENGAPFINGTAVDEDGLTLMAAQWATEEESAVTIVADAKLTGDELVTIVSRLSAAGVKNVKLLTQRQR
ncbi:MAG: biopolymer transporter ExbD [Pseudomonadota bacterium]